MSSIIYCFSFAREVIVAYQKVLQVFAVMSYQEKYKQCASCCLQITNIHLLPVLSSVSAFARGMCCKKYC